MDRELKQAKDKQDKIMKKRVDEKQLECQKKIEDIESEIT